MQVITFTVFKCAREKEEGLLSVPDEGREVLRCLLSVVDAVFRTQSTRMATDNAYNHGKDVIKMDIEVLDRGNKGA